MKSSEELMILIQNGSVEAFNVLYARFRSQVFGFVCKKVKGEDRDEVFQMVFLKLHQKSHLYKSEYPFSPWFFTLIRNTIIDFYRSQRIDYIGLEGSEAELHAPIETNEQESSADDFASLSDLSEDEQGLLYLKFVEGHGYRELEEHFGVKAASLRKRVSRLVKRIRNKEGLS